MLKQLLYNYFIAAVRGVYRSISRLCFDINRYFTPINMSVLITDNYRHLAISKSAIGGGRSRPTASFNLDNRRLLASSDVVLQMSERREFSCLKRSWNDGTLYSKTLIPRTPTRPRALSVMD